MSDGAASVGRALRGGARWWWSTWRRIPRAGRACFLIAFVNVAVWSVIVPPFEVPDEIVHFAYAQYLAETGQPPPQTAGAAQFSDQENGAIFGLDWGSLNGAPPGGTALNRGPWTAPESAQLQAELAASPLGPGGATVASNQPPLYYAIEAIPYWLSPSNNLLTRLWLMRLFSALMAAGTVLAVFLFLRELLPGTPWSWTVGALMVAFQPTFAFIGAGVQADNLLYLASASTFFLITRAWRRGLTNRRAALIGAALAVGVLSKLTFLALVPGAGLALLWLAWRERPAGTRRALTVAATGIAVAAVPVGLYLLLNVAAWSRSSPTAGGLTSVTAGPVGGSSGVAWHETLDYAWELYLPRLSFLNHNYFPGQAYPLWSVWLRGSVGDFGLLDYTFPPWVYQDFQYLVYGLAALGAIAIWRLRSAIRRLLGLFTCWGVMALGLLAVVGYLGAQAAIAKQPSFPQARYLFPLLALYALAIVLACRGLPRRWAPVLGALLVALAFAHNLFAELLTISRYYG